MKPFARLGYWLYASARSVLRATGLVRVARRLVGAPAARWVSRAAGGPGAPLRIQGHTMVLAPPGAYASPDMSNNRYEVATTRLMQQLVRPGDTVLDVGAHVGYYSLLAARQVGPQGHIYAFEPEPRNFELLSRNIAANGYTNIVARQLAVSATNGRQALYLSPVDNGFHSLSQLGRKTHPAQRVVEVETTTLDAFLAGEGWPRIDVLKMDIEGAETSAFRGMRQFFARTTDLRLVIEFCPWILEKLGIRPHEYLGLLQRLGFALWVIEEPVPRPLEQVNGEALIDRLQRQVGHVNLLGVRGPSVDAGALRFDGMQAA